MDKIKAFFGNKVLKIIAWVLLALSVIARIFGGATIEAVTNGVVLAGAIVAVVAELIAFISGQVSKKVDTVEKEEEKQ